MTLPLRHVSIRVPWHDTSWDGRVCTNPSQNGSCLRLKGIGEKRNDAAEQSVAGRSLSVLPQESWPCCVTERVSFMAPFEFARVADHPYKRTSEATHGHFAPTPLRHPPYSAAAVPFAWMLKESMEVLAEEYALDVQPEREPNLGFKTQWIQERLNQTALLNCFVDHLKPRQSLCFFYAKHVPFVEDAGGRRILIGVGRVQHVGPCEEYRYTTRDLKDKLRSMLWERMVQHSIRPTFDDGFVLPYHDALARAASNRPANPVCFSAGGFASMSYGGAAWREVLWTG